MLVVLPPHPHAPLFLSLVRSHCASGRPSRHLLLTSFAAKRRSLLVCACVHSHYREDPLLTTTEALATTMGAAPTTTGEDIATTTMDPITTGDLLTTTDEEGTMPTTADVPTTTATATTTSSTSGGVQLDLNNPSFEEDDLRGFVAAARVSGWVRSVGALTVHPTSPVLIHDTTTVPHGAQALFLSTNEQVRCQSWLT